jgi:hypothetical protein
MAGKRLLFAGLALAGLFAAAPKAEAGVFFGEWGWCWHQDRDCPHGVYHWLHYWAPEVYKARAWVHPSYLDQYPPGPYPSPPVHIEFQPSPCRSQPPAPSAPYADPAAYFGRSTRSVIAPP